MNKERREKFITAVTEILKKHHLFVDDTIESRTAVQEVVREMDRLMYDALNRKVPYDDYQAIWKRYNLEGGWTVLELSKHYRVSTSTIEKIIHDMYW